MKNSKYIKVSVSDRLPEKRDYFHTDKGQLVFLPFAGWYRGCMKVADPDYWLLEVPDYEEEMKEFIQYVSDTMPSGSSLQEKAKTLLTKLKTES